MHLLTVIQRQRESCRSWSPFPINIYMLKKKKKKRKIAAGKKTGTYNDTLPNNQIFS